MFQIMKMVDTLYESFGPSMLVGFASKIISLYLKKGKQSLERFLLFNILE